MIKLFIPLLLVIGLLITSPVRAGDDPTFGDDLLNWVNNQANARSTELVEKDLQLRTLNFRSIGIERSLQQLEFIIGEINRIDIEIVQEESNLADSDITIAAIRRERTTDRHIAEIMDLYARIIDTRELVKNMGRTLEPYEFQLNGMHTIGRETLLASFTGMQRQADTLRGQYSVNVSVSFDSSGRYQDSSFEGSVTGSEVEYALDGVVLALAQYCPWLYAYYGIKFIFIADDALEFEEQRRKVDEAARILPDKLLSPKQIYSVYEKHDQAVLHRFQGNLKEVTDLIDQVEVDL